MFWVRGRQVRQVDAVDEVRADAGLAHAGSERADVALGMLLTTPLLRRGAEDLHSLRLQLRSVLDRNIDVSGARDMRTHPGSNGRSGHSGLPYSSRSSRGIDRQFR